jgi:hypothetical protein
MCNSQSLVLKTYYDLGCFLTDLAARRGTPTVFVVSLRMMPNQQADTARNTFGGNSEITRRFVGERI